MPFFEIVGVTSTEKTYSVGFAFLTNEKEENFAWALQMCVSLLRSKDITPKVIVTDRDTTLMNAVAEVFPNSVALVCSYHVKKNVKAKCKRLCQIKDGEIKDGKKVKQTDVWDTVMDYFENVLDSPIEEQYVDAILEFRRVCQKWPRFVTYVQTTVLDTDKEKVVKAWTNHVMHIGNTTTNRVESQHGRLKKYLLDGHGDFTKVWEAVQKMLINQFTELQASFGKSKTVVEHIYKDHFLYSLLLFKISRKALKFIHQEEKRSEECGMDPKKCGCVIRKTFGLPCACLIAKKIRNKLPIRLDEVNNHWKRLVFDHEEGVEKDEDDYSCLTEWKAIQVRLIYINLITKCLFLHFIIF
jgi:alpha-glucosidase